MRFTKMEGLGNDYIYLNCLSHRPPDPAGLAVRLSDRHFGVGADGLICVCLQKKDKQPIIFYFMKNYRILVVIQHRL